MEYITYVDINGVRGDIPVNQVGNGAPTTSTVGAVGQFYMDKSTEDYTLYKCVNAKNGVYTWVPFVANNTGGGGESVGSGIWYGSTSTSANTTLKVVTTETGDFKLVRGARLGVKFLTNTYVINALDVDGTGEVAIKGMNDESGTTDTASVVWHNLGQIQWFTYDGTYFIADDSARATVANGILGKVSVSDSVSSTGDTVASSTAVKTAYDKAVEALKAAETGGGSNDSPITLVENTDSSNRVPLRSLSSGTYVLKGYFTAFEGSTASYTFSTGMLVAVVVSGGITYVQIFYPKNNTIQYLEITDDDVVRQDAKLINMASVANMVTQVDADSDDSHYPTAKAVYDALSSVGGGSVELDTTLTQEGQAADAKAVGDKISEVSEAIADKADKAGWTPDKYIGTDAEGNLIERDVPAGGGTGGGISTTAINLLIDILKVGMFTTNVSGKIDSLKEALLAGSSGNTGEDDGGDTGGGETTTDDITVSGGIMTIVSVGSAITVSNGIMSIA